MYKRDGLLSWYDRGKFRDFLKDKDEHFKTIKIVNFDIINKDLKKKEISKETLKGYQTLNHEQVMTYPLEVQKIFSDLPSEQKGKICFFKKNRLTNILKNQ